MSEDTIVKLDLGCRPEAAVSGAVLVETESSTFLTFNAVKPKQDGSGFYEDAGTAVVEFPRCAITQFGYPNDEARWGIPRYKDVSYGIYEVTNSEWIREVTRLNRYSFPDTGDDATSRHFIVAFHDSTFECIADEIKIELFNEPYVQIFGRIAQRVVAE